MLMAGQYISANSSLQKALKGVKKLLFLSQYVCDFEILWHQVRDVLIIMQI